jgi:hypothetical protein
MIANAGFVVAGALTLALYIFLDRQDRKIRKEIEEMWK